jgi:thiol-disulfide isomerase/thioredoxin
MRREVDAALPRMLPVVLFLGLCFGAALARIFLMGQTLVNKPAPEFVREDLSGKELDLAAFRGKVVLLNFWATWCAPCQLEMPRFIEWQSEYGPRGFEVIGISMDDDPELARKLCAKLGVNYPVAMGDARIGRLYGGILGLPASFLIDANGKIRAVYRGETDPKTIETEINKLLP